jgi:hypothetical protein
MQLNELRELIEEDSNMLNAERILDIIGLEFKARGILARSKDEKVSEGIDKLTPLERVWEIQGLIGKKYGIFLGTSQYKECMRHIKYFSKFKQGGYAARELVSAVA